MTQSKWLQFILFISLTALSVVSCANSQEDQKALVLFDKIFDAWLDRSPVWQSELGIKTQNDRWDDLTDAYALAGQELQQQQLQSLTAINSSKLSPSVRLSLQLMKQQLEMDLDHFQWRYHSYPVNQMFGWHTTVPSTLINIHLIESEQDANDYIARVSSVPTLMAQLIESLEQRAKRGIIAPSFVFPMVIDDSLNLLKGEPFEPGEPSTLLADFSTKISSTSFPEPTKKALIIKLNDALKTQLKPGYELLVEYLKELQKKSDDRDGAWKFPDGLAFYNAALRRTTTTDMSADDIHQLGLQEVARIHSEMYGILTDVKFKGDLQDFFNFMKNDKQFYYSNDEQGRQTYLTNTRAKIAKMQSRLPELFKTLPKAELKVKAVEAFREKSAGKAFYQSPPPDGSRPGIYYANLHNMQEMPIYQMDALLYHEALPGHHLQLSVAAELAELPKFRKFGHYTAYVEGWGLYAELLPREIGLYEDPYADFGRLDMELWRACRLVVDTGIHAKKWTRQQAIDYLLKNTPTAESSARRAIERYIVMPSQATAYKIGMLKILEIRDILKQRQKDGFDVREFHDQLLHMGPVPLNILQQQMLKTTKKSL